MRGKWWEVRLERGMGLGVWAFRERSVASEGPSVFIIQRGSPQSRPLGKRIKAVEALFLTSA